MSSRMGFVLLAFLAYVTVSVDAQTDVDVSPAELAAGFGATEGSLVAVNDQLVFVNSDDPGASFAIARSNVASLDRDQNLVTIALRNPVRSQRQFVFRLEQPAGVSAWYEAASRDTAANVPAPSGRGVLSTYQVRHDHLVGGCTGQLIVMEDRLAFESLDQRNDSRQWVYADVSEIEQDGIYRFKVRPFLGNEYNFELVGRGMDSQEYRELIDRIATARAR